MIKSQVKEIEASDYFIHNQNTCSNKRFLSNDYS